MTNSSPARRKWQISSAWLGVCSALGCSAASAPAPTAPNVQSEGKVTTAVRARAALATQLAAAPHDDLLHCQTSAGDCLISVAERREELVRTDYLNGCRDPDPEKQGPCVAQELEKRQHFSDLASYLEIDNWCSRKLLECTTALASDAAHLAVRQRTRDRRAQVELAPTSVTAARAPELATDKLAFLRSTLPPQAQGACSNVAPTHCPDTPNLPSSQLEAELAKDPQGYDAERALGFYAAIQQAKADCSTPELGCLSNLFSQYGATPASDKLVQQNLDLISKLQRASTQVELDAAQQCLSRGVLQHGDRIVSAYQTYAREPVAASLVLVQKAFVSLHEEQLKCVTLLKKPDKR